MKLRSNCKCNCHNNEHITLHEKPCCIDNPTIEDSWNRLQEAFLNNGINEEAIPILKYCFYVGATTVLLYIDLARILDTDDAFQMLTNLNEEGHIFMKTII